MFIVLSNHQGAEAAGLRDFLPKAGSIVKYEEIRTYKDKTSSKITDTLYFDWMREKDKEYFVRTSKGEEKATVLGSEFLQVNESTIVMEVTLDHLATVSSHGKRRGAIQNIVYKAVNSPPLIVWQWPFTDGMKWDQEFNTRWEVRDKPPRVLSRTLSHVVTGPETIYTPAGKFRAWRIESTEKGIRMIAWWASGRWQVKWQVDGPRYSSSGELVEFKEPEN